MRRRSIEMPDERLEAVLRDVGAHLALDVPATATATATGTATERPAMVTTVLARIAELDNHDVRDPAGSRPPRRRFGGERRRSLVLVGAGAVVVVALVLAIAPTRDAVAGWFGIGAVRITTTDPGTPGGAGPRAEASTPPTLSPESSPSTSAAGPVDVAALARTLAFTVRLPDPAVAGHPVAAAIDRAVPSGLIEITYDEFTLVELASSDGASPVIDKRVGAGTTVTPVTVGTRPGLWLAGEPHEVAIVDPDGELVHDSVRRAGNVLVWEDGGVTYRIEGLASLERALDIAVSLR